jgi:hypothetical protein
MRPSQNIELHGMPYKGETTKVPHDVDARIIDLNNDDTIALARSGKKEVLTVTARFSTNTLNEKVTF